MFEEVTNPGTSATGRGCRVMPDPDSLQTAVMHLATAVRALGIESLVRAELDCGTLRDAADLRPGERRGEKWRRANTGSTDPIDTVTDGESSWSDQLAEEKLRELERDERRLRLSSRSDERCGDE